MGLLLPTDMAMCLVRPGNLITRCMATRFLIKVTKQNPLTGKREGRITAVIMRKQTEFTGIAANGNQLCLFVPDSDKPMPDFIFL